MTRTLDLDRRIAQCAEWATEAILTFSDGHRVWDEVASEAVQPFDKMIIESALMALIAERAIPGHSAVRRLLDAIEACTVTLDRLYLLIRQRPFLWSSIGSVWLILDKFDRGDPDKRTRLRSLWADAPTAHPCERVPYRLLDQAWTRSLVNGSDPQLASEGLRAATSFENLDGALLMETRDLYAVTHTVMYLSDFGRVALRDNEAGNAAAWIDSLAASRLLMNDLDLAGELAMSSLMLGSDFGTGSLVTMATLSAIFDSLGFVPSPTFRADDYEASSDPQSYLYFHSYHTTLVYGLLCAALVARSRAAGPATQAISGAASTTVPSEWCGRRAGVPGLSHQVAHTISTWSAICDERGVDICEADLLRTALNAYLIRGANECRADDIVALLGMTSLVTPNGTDEAAQQLLTHWRALSTDVVTPC
ncbi:hypothetical protein C6A85_000000107380 [Mycobacterium sp. ITM-2017-0098]|nr:hypothetical protein C6A85_000000107380 [Mycobacterium sp. ITM-2017-0098]